MSLNGESKSIVLGLSDMSGPSMMPGFERYLTGYPLQSAGLYALAATWYAPEMARPGCVWTHTLLLDFAGLAAIVHLGALENLFQRPKSLSDLDQYQRPVLFEPGIDTTADQVNIAGPRIVEALYEQDQPVYCVATDAWSNNELALNLWSQQWPKLRRVFTFCTGAISPRNLKGRTFDLQFLPDRNRSRFSRVQGFFLEEGHGTKVISIPEESWIALATDDLRLARTDLRKFFNEYGPEVDAERYSFRKLTRVFDVATDRSIPFENVLQTVSQEFPERDAATHLKLSVLRGTILAAGRMIPSFDPATALKVLINEGLSSHFPVEGETIGFLARAAWTKHGENFAESAAELIETSLDFPASAIVEGISQVITDDQLSSLALSDSRLLPALISVKEDFAANPVIWRLPPQKIEQILSALGEPQSWSLKKFAVILSANLQAGSYGVVSQIGTYQPDYAVPVVLNWMNDQSAIDDMYRLEAVLANQERRISEWLRNQAVISSKLLGFILTIYQFNITAFDCPLRTWLPLASSESLWSEEVLIKSKAAVMDLALNSRDSDAALLGAHAFESVHDYLRRDSMPWRSWDQLSRGLPAFSFFSNWDKAQRLRKGLLNRFVDFGWARPLFLVAFRNNQNLDLILNSDSVWYAHFGFIEGVFLAIERGELEATPTQRSMLSDFVRRYR